MLKHRCILLKQTLCTFKIELEDNMTKKGHIIFLNGHRSFINVYFPSYCILKSIYQLSQLSKNFVGKFLQVVAGLPP